MIPSEDTTALEKNKGTLTKSEDTIEFDMKGTRRKRDNQLEASPCSFIHILSNFIFIVSISSLSYPNFMIKSG